jgi:UDP-N-acetylglucosamine 2-epimerase (non-hydrolysing)
MHVLTVVGARPQFIKAFAVSRELREYAEETLVHTGQHYDEEMSDIFFEELEIPRPDYNLGIGSGPHGKQTAEMIIEIEKLVKSHEPDVILTYGDTNSTLAAGIVGSKVDVEFVHVEAGLRSYNREMPEEINRVLTDHAADYLFTPSERATQNLQQEGLEDCIYQIGDVMYDSLLWARDRASEHSTILEDLALTDSEYVLVTIHRPRNTDNPERLETIVETLGDLSQHVVFPAHPRTVNALQNHGLYEYADSQLQIIDPVGYLDFVRLMDSASYIGTDSGGIQKEAFFLDTPCATFRAETEWDETVESGWNVLVDANPDEITEALTRKQLRSRKKPTPYGDGNASERIVKILRSEISS